MSRHENIFLRRCWPTVWLVAALLLWALPLPARAQSGIGDIVYTVGTTVHDSHGRDWAYILWQGTQPGLVSNRVFAVYSKTGDATNNAPYTRLSLVSVQTDARVIEPLLERAANLGDDMLKLDQDIGQLFGSFIPPSSITRADQLSAVIRGSLGHAESYQNLMLLARNHAGIDLALGFADAELIPPGVTTFEVRAFDPVTSRDLAVIGRVTVEAGHPTVLPPPGPPVLVPETSPMGDLNLKFRWGTPDNLRRLGLIQFGYNLYRVEKNFATSQGWSTVNPPPDNILLALIATNPAAAKRVNVVPLTPATLFSVAAAANLTPPGNTNTFFIMDADGRGKPGYFNHGWTNGAQFYYYVAGRDVLGRDGLFSTGLLATVCDRMPPLPPTGVHVRNDFQYDPNTLTAVQALRIDWKQNLRTNDTVVNYWIYRWTNSVEMNALSGNPGNNLIGIVGQIPGATNNSYLDIGPSSPTALGAYGKTFWYTVRAADAGACGQNFSGAAGPAYGVLRQRVGPGAGTGYIEINCLQPIVNYLGTRNIKQATDTNNFDFLLTCTRLNARFDWAEFYGIATYTIGGVAGPPTVLTVSNYFGRLDYLGNPQVSARWSPPRDPSGQGSQYSSISMQVWCRAALNNGKISSFNIQSVTPPDMSSYAEVDFQALAQSVRVIAGSAGNRSDCYEHDPGGGGGGVSGTNNIGIHIIPSPGSKEYRLYRRVDNGPLSLLCDGSITNLAQFIECFEDAPPVNGGTICFFLQLLDENGNPSPMTPLQPCVDTAPSAALPVPVLATITPVGTDPTNAAMSLSWFCPPYGVERFEVRIAALPTKPDTNLFALSPQLLSTGAPPALMLFTNSGKSVSQPFYSFITPKVGPGFGNNSAQFSIPGNIEVGKQYFVTVRALSQHNDPGDFSNFEPFIWIPSNAPSLKVPWPARPLPGTNANFLALAFYLSPTNASGPLQTAAPAGNGVLIGFGSLTFREATLALPPLVYGPLDPNALLETNVFGDSIFPCTLYRYQVPNANFPAVSGDMIQVSPLMENIAYQWSGVKGQTTNTFIQDPFVAVSGLANGSGNYLYLWLRDMQPQISGARYKYILVRFNPVTHEIDQLIPSNEVVVP
jgi:hypothetical protein